MFRCAAAHIAANGSCPPHLRAFQREGVRAWCAATLVHPARRRDLLKPLLSAAAAATRPCTPEDTPVCTLTGARRGLLVVELVDHGAGCQRTRHTVHHLVAHLLVVLVAWRNAATHLLYENIEGQMNAKAVARANRIGRLFLFYTGANPERLGCAVAPPGGPPCPFCP